jgi:hypothetical protein
MSKVTPELRERVRQLYKPPFRYESGYIFDANGQMVSDDRGPEGSVQRIRGWGRISYMENAAELQDAVGEVIAEILTKEWSA